MFLRHMICIAENTGDECSTYPTNSGVVGEKNTIDTPEEAEVE